MTDTLVPSFSAPAVVYNDPSKTDSNPSTLTRNAYSTSPVGYVMTKHLSRDEGLTSLQSVDLTFGISAGHAMKISMSKGENYL